ncbi:hypothetical protein [Roseibium sp.]|uniref:hypothetical protein n=1 Tax=Roseibium sp. TaxID=1936156 RepID=UPI003BAAB4C0
MPAILEIIIAGEASDSIDTTGACTHRCVAHAPLGLAKPEADDLRRFDPDSFQRLEEIGVSVHDVEIDDFEEIAAIAHLEAISHFDNKNAEKLYKHAIALRLNRSLLISNQSSEKQSLEKICIAFGNDFQII